MAKYTAVPYVAGSPEALVIGQTMLAFLENVQGELIAPIMQKYGLETIEPEQWYSHQLWMDILRELERTLEGEAQSAFVAIGREVVRKAVMPPEMDSIPVALNSLHAIHHLNLQHVPEDEGYVVKELGPKHFQVCQHPQSPRCHLRLHLGDLCALQAAPRTVHGAYAAQSRPRRDARGPL